MGMDSEVSWAEKWREYMKENLIQVGLVGVGFVLLVAGLGVVLIGQVGDDSSVEIIPVGNNEEGVMSNDKIVVDVAGAVETPGVYELSEDSRVNDALTAAGGFAKDADRIWVRRFVNLAQKVPDGAKLYIPTEGEAGEAASNSGSPGISGNVAGVATIGLGQETSGKININSASTSELDSLWGIGEKRAADIISNRPYSSVEELLTKAGIPKNVYERIKDEVAAF